MIIYRNFEKSRIFRTKFINFLGYQVKISCRLQRNRGENWKLFLENLRKIMGKYWNNYCKLMLPTLQWNYLRKLGRNNFMKISKKFWRKNIQIRKSFVTREKISEKWRSLKFWWHCEKIRGNPKKIGKKI